ncbi:CoA transferase [Microbacterium sp. LWH7-1.2]|uniref:CaiB/BaiF CoA-transferase family protein n=1 Tax=Microbacterium sp. LWH7-1.2 TaxID=3135257 RepID=UPI003138D788
MTELAGVWGGRREGPLSGIRVLDLGQYIAGPMTAMLLADQGADVVRIERPGGPRWRSPANTALLRNRTTLELDLKGDGGPTLIELSREADVLIENFRPGVMARLGLGHEYLLEEAPQLVYCSLPGFGSNDPRAGVPGWEGPVMASAGAYASPDTGSMYADAQAPDDAPPMASDVPLASVFAAIHGALSISAGLLARERDGHGQWIEVPLHDSLFEASGSRAMTFERNPPPFTSFGSGVYVCEDGRHVTFLANWHRHLLWFLTAAGRDDWIDDGSVDYELLWTDASAGDRLRDRLVELFRERPAGEWERIGRAAGCTIAMVRSTAEWLEEPATIRSGAVVRTADPEGGEVSVPGIAVASRASQVPAQESSARAAAATGPDERPPLDGVRVLEMSLVVAAPTTGRLLAELGADVIRIGADPATSRAIFPEPLMHVQLNRGKRTAIVDLKTESGQEWLRGLVPSCDAAIQNFTMGTAERLGVDPESLRGLRPDIVTLYLNAFGTTGPWAAHRGFAEIANVASGLTDHVLDGTMPASGSSPIIDRPRWFFTDYAAGALGAFGVVLGLLQRARSGVGADLSTSLFSATALEQITWIAGHRAAVDAEPGEQSVRGVHRTADGWISVHCPAESLARVRAEFGADAAADPARTLGEAVLHLDRSAACDLVVRLGGGAQPVLSLSDVMAPDGLAAARGLRIAALTADHGVVTFAGPVARFSRTRMVVAELPAPFGSDTDSLEREFGCQMRPHG